LKKHDAQTGVGNYRAFKPPINFNAILNWFIPNRVPKTSILMCVTWMVFFALESLKCFWNASDSNLGRLISQSSILFSLAQFLKANSRVVCLKVATICPSPSTSLPTNTIMTTFHLNHPYITYAVSRALFSPNTLLTGGRAILSRSAAHISHLATFTVTTVTTQRS